MVTLCQLNCHVCRLAAAQNLFLLTRVCSELYERYVFLIDHITDSLDPPGYLRYSETEARGASGCCSCEAFLEPLPGHPDAPRASALENRK